MTFQILPNIILPETEIKQEEIEALFINDVEVYNKICQNPLLQFIGVATGNGVTQTAPSGLSGTETCAKAHQGLIRIGIGRTKLRLMAYTNSASIYFIFYSTSNTYVTHRKLNVASAGTWELLDENWTHGLSVGTWYKAIICIKGSGDLLRAEIREGNL